VRIQTSPALLEPGPTQGKSLRKNVPLRVAAATALLFAIMQTSSATATSAADPLAASGTSPITCEANFAADTEALRGAERNCVDQHFDPPLRDLRLAATASGGPGETRPGTDPALLVVVGLVGLAYAGSRPY